jgi:hypothetical protein
MPSMAPSRVATRTASSSPTKTASKECMIHYTFILQSRHSHSHVHVHFLILCREQFSAQFAAACNKFQIAEEPSSALFGILDGFAAEQEVGYDPHDCIYTYIIDSYNYTTWLFSFISLENKLKTEEKVFAKRVKELEDQRTRLEKDLQSKVENVRMK